MPYGWFPGSSVALDAEEVSKGLARIKVSLNTTETPTSPLATKTLLTVSGAAASSGDNTLIAAPGAGVQFVITGITLQNESAVATLMKLTKGAGGAVISRVLGQNQGDGLAITFTADARPKVGNNVALVLNLNGANSCGYTIWYYTEAA